MACRSFLIPLFCFFLSFSAVEAKKNKKYQLSATAIFCNEARFLPEWIEYYQLVGVEHFYLYNNLSTDHYLESLTPYIEKGIVDLIDWPQVATHWGEWNDIQILAHRDAIKRAKKNSKWLAIIDIDEFIVPVKEGSLLGVLKKYENKGLGGICAMWAFFGTSHVEKIPENKIMIETLILSSGPASNGDVHQVWRQGSYKSIIRPEYISDLPSPHYAHYEKGRHHEMAPFDELRINHYWTRDNDFFVNTKIPRRMAWGQDNDSIHVWAAGMNGSPDNNPIIRFVEKLREKMRINEQ